VGVAGGGDKPAAGLPALPTEGGLRAAPFLAQLALQAERAAVFRLRDAGKLVLFGLLHVFMALALSSGFSILTQKSYTATLLGPVLPAFAAFVPPALRSTTAAGDLSDLGLQQLMFFLTISAGTASGMSSISNLGGLRAAFAREVAGGASALALALGRLAAELFIVGWVAACFTGTWMLFGHAGHWWDWLAVVAGTSFAASGVGHVCSVLAEPTPAATLVQIVLIVFSVFSGVQPRLKDVAVAYPVLNWAWYLSLANHASQGAFAAWAAYMAEYRDVASGAASFGYAITGGVGPHVGALVGLGLLWRGVAVALLVLQLGGRGQRAQRII
jgi:hypothetical protein